MPSFESHLGNLKKVDVKILHVDTNSITPIEGKALFRIPIVLDQTPTREWGQIFINVWKLPPSFSSIHRPSIANVEGNCIILNGTTIEEIEAYHKETLKLTLEETNKKYNAYVDEKTRELHQQKVEESNLQAKIKEQQEKGKNINFN